MVFSMLVRPVRLRETCSAESSELVTLSGRPSPSMSTRLLRVELMLRPPWPPGFRMM